MTIPGATTCEQCGRPIDAGAQFCAHCGFNVSSAQGDLATRMVPPKSGATLQMQDVLLERLRESALGDYEVLTELGRGGMATVYLGHDLQLDRKVAIKVMLPELLEGEGMIDRFKLEARTAAQLSHPHIIPIYAVRDVDDLLYFVMKFVEGRPLDSIVTELTKLPISMAQMILSKTGEALGYAHRRGVVHRDIKPANLMIDTEGLPIVTDFGIAKVADSRGLTMTGATIGTPTYMSPEQCSAGTITGSSDQYSLGVVAYQMLAGKLPFMTDNIVSLLYMHCHEPAPPFMDARPDCPPALHDAVMKMLAKKPADRFPSLEAAVQAIGGASLAFDDPVRLQLVDLAKRGGNLSILQRVKTPRSPTPTRSKTAAKRTGVATAAQRSQASQRTVAAAPPSPSQAVITAASPAKSRGLMIGVAAVVGIGGVALGVWRPWDRPAPPPPVAPVTAPAVAASVALQPSTGTLDVNGSMQLAATTLDSSGRAMTNAPITWTSDNPAIATVSPGGLVQALAPGTTQIRATSGAAFASAQLTINAPPAGSTPAVVARIRVEGAPPSLTVGGTAQLRATTLDRRGANAAGRVTWSSSSPAIVTVSPDGFITAQGAGSATLTARSGTVSQSVALQVQARTAAVTTAQVVAPRPASVAVSGAGGPLTVGATTRLSASVTGDDGRPMSVPVSWRSSNASVASVSDGLVAAVAPGTATIVASVDGKEGSTSITVSAPEVRPVVAAVEPRDAIAALIQSYARALESGQLSEVRRVYPGLTSAQVTQVEGMRNLDSLNVRLRIASVDVQGDNATGNVTGEYQFYSRENRRTERLPVRFQATFEKSATGWLIRTLR